MSRGISDLQRRILLSCLKKRFLLTRDILRELHGWQPAEWGSIKATIGEDEYNVAHASLSRTISRLSKRHLVVIWKTLTNSATGICLTVKGWKLAKAILGEDEEQ